jgi:thioredoxin-related protein
MKKIFCFLLAGLLLCEVPAFAAPPPEWGFVNIKEGFKRAQEEHKPVFILFGFENCPWCKVLYRSAFADSELRDFYRKEFVLVYMSTLGENEEKTYKLPDGQELSAKEITKSWKVYPVPSWRWLRPDGSLIGTDSNARTTAREFRFKGENALKAVASK